MTAERRSQRSSVDLVARPALPGLRLVADEVSGTVGPCAGDEPPSGAGGRLTVWLRALVDGDSRAETSVPGWLRRGEPAAIDAIVDEVVPDGRGRVTVRLTVHAGGRVLPVTGAGRVERSGAGSGAGEIEAVGLTVVDPRALGIALPPLVTFALHVRWRLVLDAGGLTDGGRRVL